MPRKRPLICFEECYWQGVLTSEFFLDNKRFLGKIPLKPDPELRAAFFAADKRAQDLAQLQLKSNPDDPNALFAMTLSLGMQADYASLIDKHQLDSLKMIRQADTYAKKLLVIAPDAADAYLGLGTANYIIGSLPGIKKFFLGFAGIHGDKKVGIQQLEIAAATCDRLRRFYWPWRPCARRSRKWPALSLANSSRSFRRTRSLPVSWRSSRLLMSWQLLLNSDFLLSRMCLSWRWYLERCGTAQPNFWVTRYVCRTLGMPDHSYQTNGPF